MTAMRRALSVIVVLLGTLASARAGELQIASRSSTRAPGDRAAAILGGPIFHASAFGSDGFFVTFPGPPNADGNLEELRGAIIDAKGAVTELAVSDWIPAAERAAGVLGQISSASLSPDGRRLAVVIGWRSAANASRNGVAWLERASETGAWKLSRVTEASTAIREAVWVAPDRIVVADFRPPTIGTNGSNGLRVLRSDGTESESFLLSESGAAAQSLPLIRLAMASPTELGVFQGSSSIVTWFDVDARSPETKLTRKDQRPAMAPETLAREQILAFEARPDGSALIVRKGRSGDRKVVVLATLSPAAGEPRSLDLDSHWNAGWFSGGSLMGIGPDRDATVIETVIFKP